MNYLDLIIHTLKPVLVMFLAVTVLGFIGWVIIDMVFGVPITWGWAVVVPTCVGFIDVAVFLLFRKLQ